MSTLKDRLVAKVAPESVMLTLARAGCFLSAYELIKAEVVDKVHEFFWCGFDETGHQYDEDSYRKDVLSRDPKSRYRASCAWLVAADALTPAQVEILEAIYEHRKQVAHELPKLLIDPDFEVNADLLLDALECLRRLGVFWGSIEADANPDFDGQEVNYDDIKSGSFLMLEYLVTLAGLSEAKEDA